MSTKDPGCKVPPHVPNGYPVDWPVGGFTGTPPPVTFICESGYSLSGDAKLTCGVNETWVGDAQCVPWDITESGWFWAVVASVVSLVAVGSIAVIIYCVHRRCCRRNRIRSNVKEDDTYKDNCCLYGGSCDVCGCIDYEGCCSLTGCCGYHGACAPFCSFCRCCREPDEKHFHKNVAMDISEYSRSRTSKMNKLRIKNLDNSKKAWEEFKINTDYNVKKKVKRGRMK
ncbi:hypothetical protein FSP39_005776 [Pinctada imbricata]|uniref:Sushi domain-containing protein n=1 Tax=Pinctada imbricata TaxID=66713 RepID=A0AA88YBN8_PINIB|nr:hypothetical protein FSP39_005776 [Pinctada imbricata]